MLCEKKVGSSGMGMKRFWGSVVLNTQKVDVALVDVV